jgi:predicted enzyme related to lactoylglutathione lyase
MNRPVFFEIPTQNAERAQAFYSTLFGWTFNKYEGMDNYWLISTGEGPGIDGGLMARPGPVTNTCDVPSLSKAIETVEANGGKVVVQPQTIPGVGTLAYCTDPDGNIFGIIEPPAA